jgi:hypothetical protein
MRDTRTAPDLEALVAVTHYKPDAWVGSENTWEVRDEVRQASAHTRAQRVVHRFFVLQVADLYEFKATSLLRELAAILIGPFILFFSTASRQSTSTHRPRVERSSSSLGALTIASTTPIQTVAIIQFFQQCTDNVEGVGA